jgi:hypothetical protein
MLTLAACDRAFTQQPKTTDLTGTYQLSKRSKDWLLKRKGYNALPVSEITLGADYSISILNLADCATNGFGHSAGTFVSGKGNWELEKDFVGWGLNLHIDKGGSLREAVYAGPWMGIRGRSAPYRLEIAIGDPDSGETIQYEKKGS